MNLTEQTSTTTQNVVIHLEDDDNSPREGEAMMGLKGEEEECPTSDERGVKFVHAAHLSDRKRFISKVFSIVAVQFLVLFAFVMGAQIVANQSQSYWIEQCMNPTTQLGGEIKGYFSEVPDAVLNPIRTKYEDLNGKNKGFLNAAEKVADPTGSVHWQERRVAGGFAWGPPSTNTEDILETIYFWKLNQCWRKEWVGSSRVVLILFLSALAVWIVTYIMICCECGFARRSPGNMIMLCLFTVALSMMVGCVTLAYTAASVFLCLGVTVLVVGALGLFASYTKTDFTGIWPFLWAVGFLLFFATLLVLPLHFAGILTLKGVFWLSYLLNFVGALITVLWIVWCVQMIIGGEDSRYQFAVDQYCAAATFLFNEIVSLFLYILQAMGSQR